MCSWSTRFELLLIFLLTLCATFALLYPELKWRERKDHSRNETKRCIPNPDDIKRYQGIADKIIQLATSGNAQNQSYNRLALFTDIFGNRISGSKNLEHAIDFLLNELEKDGLENVHGEEAMVPHWVRGSESLVMLKPRFHEMAMLGLGSSVGTPSGGITAEVIVVQSFEELHSRASEAKGKIVVFNQKWEGYGKSVAYRSNAAVETSKVGGVASLVRSVTPFSINSPHTGWQDYVDEVKKIPTACITVEDAEMLYRMSNRGTKIELQLKMGAQNLPPVKSRNTVAEIVGSTYPEEVVLVSGHLDSWDVGEGAMDDGGGAFVSWQVLTLLNKLKLKPKRTVRLVMWTGEEEGGFGGQTYFNNHKGDISNYNLVMESDSGTFTPVGITFKAIYLIREIQIKAQGNDLDHFQDGQLIAMFVTRKDEALTGQFEDELTAIVCIGSKTAIRTMQEIMNLLKSINASIVKPSTGDVGTDIGPWVQAGVPGAGLSVDGFQDEYFFFHHSNGDTMTVQDPHQMDLCSAVWAVVAYVVADMDCMLPR